jgi:hypothetical protein
VRVAILAIASGSVLFAQTAAATANQQLNFCKHLLLQMAGIGRPSEETARRQTALVAMSGLSASDANILLGASASLEAPLAAPNRQASALAALGTNASNADNQSLATLNQSVQQLLTSAANALLTSLSPDGVQRLSAIAARQPSRRRSVTSPTERTDQQ